MCEDSELAGNVVHIWEIPLALRESRVQCCRHILSEDENQRADLFCFDRDRNRFIAGRSALRKILSIYLRVAPEQLAFCYGPKGKPELAPGMRDSGIKFNLSHSRGVGLLAVTQGNPVGVDIEHVDHEFASTDIAARFFSEGEVDVLRALAPGQRAEAFFSCWTRKEAYVKALGEGLSVPLDSFDVAFGPGVPAALLRVKVSPQEVLRWSMYDLTAPPGYAAALVIEGRGHQLQHRPWQAEPWH